MRRGGAFNVAPSSAVGAITLYYRALHLVLHVAMLTVTIRWAPANEPAFEALRAALLDAFPFVSVTNEVANAVDDPLLVTARLDEGETFVVASRGAGFDVTEVMARFQSFVAYGTPPVQSQRAPSELPRSLR